MHSPTKNSFNRTISEHMYIGFRIGILTLFFTYLIDFQTVIGQNSNRQDFNLSELFQNSPGLKLQPEVDTKSNTAQQNPGLIFAWPITDRDAKLKQINNINWKVIADENVKLQSLTLPPNQQVYIRFDLLQLAKGESLGFYDLHSGRLLDILEVTPKSSKYLAGPFYAQRIGMIIHSNDIAKTKNMQIGEIYVGAMDFGFSASFDCHQNIKCVAGENFRKQERGVVKIIMVLDEGLGFCTGSLINNTREDRTPYMLSAFHCQDGYTPIYELWEFDFGYESFSCANPDTEPSSVKVTGCERLAGYLDSDLLLLLLSDDLPLESNAYFNGWNRDPEHRPTGAVLIHHPVGDIKKITTENDQVSPHPKVLRWDNGINTTANSHWVTRFDVGTYQGGSSGGPLIDNTGLIVGQLHGGPEDDETCSIGIGYHGRLSSSWEGGETADTRLKDWLDPDNTGQLQLAGRELSETGSNFVSFVGRLVTPDGIAIPNVEVSINGDKEESFLTGLDGRFEFDNLPKSGSYTIQFKKDTNAANGLSALDMVQIMNHILGTNPLPGLFQKQSADASNDGQVSSIDLVQILNVIIGKADGFPNNTSWQFEPAVIQMDPSMLNLDAVDFAIIGYKIGDVNFSANPRN